MSIWFAGSADWLQRLKERDQRGRALRREGLAYARYKKDGDKTDGMKCIYDWLYYKDETPEEIVAAFKRFPDHTPGAVIAAMAAKECGA